MSTEAILSTARQYLEVDPTTPITLIPIKKGASGRTIARVKTPVHEDFIGIHWTDERDDNEQFVPIAEFLKKARFNVPKILYDRSQHSVALIEDLGDTDLLSLKDTPFKKRLPLYRSALEQVDRLFYARVPKDLELMPPFDADLYRWEQKYFFDYFIEDFLKESPVALEKNEAFTDMAEGLGASHKHLVHRDFQSQNLLIKDDKLYMIDFQGLRRGRQEYDLASLIFDPYMDHSADEREQLLDLWEDISDERPETSLFHKCASQRLMQALGAFGNIIENRNDEWYRQHIPVAVKSLLEVTKDTEIGEALAPILEKHYS
ncbi:MAG: phosphotransferase [Akkermansiaceae bacterium]|jgi:N-acetylmuramate 1-kinase|nr:phosphotransferase [Akkermansiaceae bacterium]MDP4646724.1 phosphotransferase [Akkermansiaceae bacterium]MDP4721067.1 phosphotransferase [Akkermansiaceae bacterium]MDP4779640.1 phosphotransferase [Akkermansiaceae bacterium]MDP4846280.1 phosphotransferase [Akkermansiaceae bacterium]